MNKLFISIGTNGYHIDEISFYSGKSREDITEKCTCPFTPKTRSDYKSDKGYQNYLENIMPIKKEEWENMVKQFCEGLIEIPLDKIINEETGYINSYGDI